MKTQILAENKEIDKVKWSIHSIPGSYPCETKWNTTSNSYYKVDKVLCYKYLENNLTTNKTWFIIM